MSADQLPPLPEPSIHAPFLKEMRTVYKGDYFTADQMREYGQASRKAALEESMIACDKVSFAEFTDAEQGYKTIRAVGANACRNKIKEMK